MLDSVNKVVRNLRRQYVGKTGVKQNYSSIHKSMKEATKKRNKMLIQSKDRINSTNLEMMEKQFDYFKARDIITNSSQNNMVNEILGLTNVLSSTFVRDSGGVMQLTKDAERQLQDGLNFCQKHDDRHQTFAKRNAMMMLGTFLI